MNKSWLLIVLVFGILITGCAAPRQTTDTGVFIDSKVDPNVYTLSLILESEESHTTDQMYLSGFSYNGLGGLRGRYWQEGKGLLRGLVTSVDPSIDFARPGQTIIIKTTDLKVLGLLPGDKVKFACTVDYEPVCAKNTKDNTETGQCIDIWEFDYCRMQENPVPSK